MRGSIWGRLRVDPRSIRVDLWQLRGRFGAELVSSDPAWIWDRWDPPKPRIGSSGPRARPRTHGCGHSGSATSTTTSASSSTARAASTRPKRLASAARRRGAERVHLGVRFGRCRDSPPPVSSASPSSSSLAHVRGDKGGHLNLSSLVRPADACIFVRVPGRGDPAGGQDGRVARNRMGHLSGDLGNIDPRREGRPHSGPNVRLSTRNRTRHRSGSNTERNNIERGSHSHQHSHPIVNSAISTLYSLLLTSSWY